MAEDNNNSTAAELPAEENSGGDIEQGRSSSSWVAAPISGRTSTADPSTTTTTTWPLGGLEHVDVEEAARVPLIQQIADMDMAEMIDKDDTNANIHANVASSEDASMTMTPQPPKQGAMEQIGDGNDAAPPPFNYAEFEDESKPKIDLGEESTDEDDGHPLPFTFGQQRDSLRNAKKMAATSQTLSSAASPINGNESIGGDEEDILQRQRVAGPENSSASDNEGARQVVSTAERYPSVPIPEAYLVEEEGPPTAVATPPPSVPVVTPGGHDTGYEATPLEPELPWWKQRRTKVLMVIICVLLASLALSVGLGVSLFSRPTADAGNDNITATTTTIITTAPFATTDASSSSSVSLSPSQSPTKSLYRCFADRNELKAAVDRYVNGCRAVATLCSDISDTYGWPIGSWCVGKVTDMSNLFEDLKTFNEDISGWEVGQVTTMKGVFRGASLFNQNLSAWNTSAVIDMSFMFYNTWYGPWTSSFNQSLSNWDTSAVTTMEAMFYGAAKFNQDLSAWNTSAVTTMRSMFSGARAFDGNISSWDTSAVTDMAAMFNGASSFNQEDLSNWDTSAVTTMRSMFAFASAFDGNISSWDTSAVTDMTFMFNGASSFNQNLCSWKDNFPYSNKCHVPTDSSGCYSVFVASGCTYQGTPSSSYQGPFCASSCNTVSPTDCFTTRYELKCKINLL